MQWSAEARGRRSGRWLPWLASAAVHSLLFLVIIHGRLPDDPRRRSPMLVFLTPPEPDQNRVSPTPFYVPRREYGSGRRAVPLPPLNPRPEVVRPPLPEPVAPLPAEAGEVSRSPAARIGPALGDGRLWVRPLPLPPRELAKRLQPTHAELVDSAVTAIVQAYLDSIAREPGADRTPLPDWTAEVHGLKFGLDSKSIYIAGLRVPAAVLALLPLPSGGNQQAALDHNGRWIAEDLRRAGMRATSLDEFKQAVRELRARKVQEREFDRARRERPDSGDGGHP